MSLSDDRPTRDEQLKTLASAYVNCVLDLKYASDMVSNAQRQKDVIVKKQYDLGVKLAEFVGSNRLTKYVIVDSRLVIVDFRNGVRVEEVIK